MEPASLLEEIRFGYGPRLGQALAPGGVDADRVLAQLTADDPLGAAWNRPSMAYRYELQAKYMAEKKSGGGVNPETIKAQKALQVGDIETFVARPAFAAAGFVERLVNMWANRITISVSTNGVIRFVQSFRDEAIRPHVGGRYADILRATLWHPAKKINLRKSLQTKLTYLPR